MGGGTGSHVDFSGCELITPRSVWWDRTAWVRWYTLMAVGEGEGSEREAGVGGGSETGVFGVESCLLATVVWWLWRWRGVQQRALYFIGLT